MQSPRAKNTPLQARDVDGVEIDVCPATQGVWLDAGELDKVSGDADIADRAIRLIPGGQLSGPSCPRCAEKGRAATLALGTLRTEDDKRPVYRCPSCAGVWIDGDVVRHLIRDHAEDDEAELREIEREAQMTEKSLLAESAFDVAEDAMDGAGGLLRGLGSLLGRLF